MTIVRWTEQGTEHRARWHSENGAPAPRRLTTVADDITANAALRRLRAGEGLLWRGDFPGARQLLKAVARRMDHRSQPAHQDIAGRFRAHREDRAERSLVLSGLVVLLDEELRLDLRRAPDTAEACRQAYGDLGEPTLVALNELQGVLSAWQWHLQGVPVPALGARVHPRHGVFSPSRSEYVDLVASAPLPGGDALTAFDLGTGTGVLAAVLARRGVARVVATDINPRAVAAARETVERLELEGTVEVLETDLFPEGRADLVVCNPPWLPGEPTSPLELGIYDGDSTMLRRFLAGLTDHLAPGGEGWLVLSDLAEHLHLRSRAQLEQMIARAGLEVVGREDTPARHPRSQDELDPLHAARSREITSLWRLRPAG